MGTDILSLTRFISFKLTSFIRPLLDSGLFLDTLVRSQRGWGAETMCAMELFLMGDHTALQRWSPRRSGCCRLWVSALEMTKGWLLLRRVDQRLCSILSSARPPGRIYDRVLVRLVLCWSEPRFSSSGVLWKLFGRNEMCDPKRPLPVLAVGEGVCLTGSCSAGLLMRRQTGSKMSRRCVLYCCGDLQGSPDNQARSCKGARQDLTHNGVS